MIRVDPSPIVFNFYFFIRSELVRVDPSWSESIRADPTRTGGWSWSCPTFVPAYRYVMWPTVRSARRSLIGATQRKKQVQCQGKKRLACTSMKVDMFYTTLTKKKHIRKEFYGEPVDNGNIEKAGKIFGTGSDSQKLILLFLQSHWLFSGAWFDCTVWITNFKKQSAQGPTTRQISAENRIPPNFFLVYTVIFQLATSSQGGPRQQKLSSFRVKLRHSKLSTH